MRAAPFHHVLKIDCLFGGLSAFEVESEKDLCIDYDAVKPMHLAEPSNAADDANIRTVYFCDDFRDFVFRDSECIGRNGRPLLHFHCNKSPDHFPHEASGECGTTQAILKTKSVRRVENHGCAASCSTLRRIRNRSARSSEYSALDCLSLISTTRSAA